MRTAFVRRCGCVSLSAGKRSGTKKARKNKNPIPFGADSKTEPPQQAESLSLHSSYKLPIYIPGDNVSAVRKQKSWFSYHNRGPLPEEAKDLLLPTVTQPPPVTSPIRPIAEARCLMDRMYVRIRKDAVPDRRAWRYLYFGNCRVNAARGAHWYFLYPLTRCNLGPQVVDDAIVFSNVIRYLPRHVGRHDIIRQPTLTIPVACRYYRFHRTYDVGIHPITGSSFTKVLPAGGIITIAVMDANWKPLPPGGNFVLGQAMYFEIRGPPGQRVFSNRCWFTASRYPNATKYFAAIKNYGCMVDSVNSSLSRFYPYSDPAVLRFSIEAFIFPYQTIDSIGQQITLHCDVSLGKTATLYRKACTYNKGTGMWHELDQRNNLLCLCCKGVCPARPRSAPPSTNVSTTSWETLDASGENLDEDQAETEDEDQAETEDEDQAETEDEDQAEPEEGLDSSLEFEEAEPGFPSDEDVLGDWVPA
ncbi:hypothetical protein GJAV_G00147560 [Gymnothorax javanicus]|nr:hypothetical protein GJAV_G00147560 [Gymnothorax javanicus]